MASKTSAVADEPIEVLFALHPKFNLMDFAGPLEVLTTCLHDSKDPSELAHDSPLFPSNPAPAPRFRRGSAVKP
jgi:transcriptional regulator GlxA family with amidase domain